MRFFVVGIEPITTEQEKSFIEYISAKQMGWWHWIPNFWLILGLNTPSCSEIRDELHRLAPSETIMVVEVSPVSWAGYGPNAGEKNMFPWFAENWDKKG
jgi:hypothetical protein